MPSKMSNAYREHEGGSIVASEQYWKGVTELQKARQKNARIERRYRKLKAKWTILPPENMTIHMTQSAGQLPAGLVLSVPHVIGRVILQKRLGRIIERDDVTVDAVIEGDVEQAFEAMELWFDAGEVTA